MNKQATKNYSQAAAQIGQARTASYIADLLKELEELAGKDRIEPLDRLLKITREEARRVSLSSLTG